MSPCVLMYVTDFAGHNTVMKEMNIIGIAVIIIVIMTITFSYLFSVKFLSLGGLFVFLCLCFFSFCVCFVVVVWGCSFFRVFWLSLLPYTTSTPPKHSPQQPNPLLSQHAFSCTIVVRATQTPHPPHFVWCTLETRTVFLASRS